MTRRSLTFGTIAATYERYRLGYPDRALPDRVDVVADLVLHLARLADR